MNGFKKEMKKIDFQEKLEVYFLFCSFFNNQLNEPSTTVRPFPHVVQ